jgi:hypothetical protein
MKKLADGGGRGDGSHARPSQVNNKIPLRFVSHPNTIGTHDRRWRSPDQIAVTSALSSLGSDSFYIIAVVLITIVVVVDDLTPHGTSLSTCKNFPNRFRSVPSNLRPTCLRSHCPFKNPILVECSRLYASLFPRLYNTCLTYAWTCFSISVGNTDLTIGTIPRSVITPIPDRIVLPSNNLKRKHWFS